MQNTNLNELQVLWLSRVEAYKKSGLTQAGFCKLNEYNLKLFNYWYRKFKKVEPPSQAENPKWISVNVRMAVADGGELLVLAPGIRKFGEDIENDKLIVKYGYKGKEQILKWCHTREDMAANLSVAAHLIHGSSDGRFAITYAVAAMNRMEIENAGYRYMKYEDAVAKYDPNMLKDGFNKMADGEEIYFINNPALGLWVDKNRHVL